MDTPAPKAPTPLHLLLVKLLTDGITPLVRGHESLTREVRAISDGLLATDGVDTAIIAQLEQLVTRMARIGDEHYAAREVLLNLLRFVIENIHELVDDDSWLKEQLASIAEAIPGTSSEPFNLQVLNAVSQQLREIIDKQSQLKRELTQAQDRLKEMLAGFIDHLSEVTLHTGDYHKLLGRSARRIAEAHNIADLSEVVGELMHGTHLAQESAQRSEQELSELRERVDSANLEIARLQSELEAASKLVRHDPLTGVLNRKGLSEALTREVSRARRKDIPLCIALIDIDDFKKLNDEHGHLTGDHALRHLTDTVTGTLRPQDIVARYGGEEFIILLPDTPLDIAHTILARLQHELTERIFYTHDGGLQPFTFSAGIALLSSDEDPQVAITRADEAMYAAKRAGKNRVLMAA